MSKVHRSSQISGKFGVSHVVSEMKGLSFEISEEQTMVKKVLVAPREDRVSVAPEDVDIGYTNGSVVSCASSFLLMST